MRKLALLVALQICVTLQMTAQGLPFIRNYPATEYNGHNQNFDIITGDDGTIYVANFEGLLYFDNAEWHMLHTPGVTRITSLYRDSKNIIWTGGFNYIGYLTTTAKGELRLKTLTATPFHGEVNWIWEKDGSIWFLTSGNQIFSITGEKIERHPEATTPTTGFATLSDKLHINQIQQLGNGLQALATNGDGVIITDQNGNRLFSIKEQDGLCSDNVAHITFNKGQLWGATDNGVFVISFPSAFSRFTTTEGLRGEVLSLLKSGGHIYAGTLSGLYRKEGRRFVPVNEITHTTWQLISHGDHLLAATMDGVFRVNNNGSVRRLTSASVLSLMADGENFYSGEMDGLYYNHADGTRQKLNSIEKVVRILKDNIGCIWLQTIYGKIWKGKRGDDFVALTSEKDNLEVATLVNNGGMIYPIVANTKKPFPYPLFSYSDNNGVIWLTNNKGRGLYAFTDEAVDAKLSRLVKPFMDYSVRAVLQDGNKLWVGGERGIFTIDTDVEPMLMKTKPEVLLRSITLREDSVLYGGYGQQPQSLPTLASNERHLRIHYSLNFPVAIGKPEFRYRVNDNKWSQWDDVNSVEMINQPYGTNILEIQGRDAFGRTSDVVRLNINYDFPLYMRWYMMALYVIALALTVYLLIRFRLSRLEKEKVRLENIVKDRTAEVVRLEKMATVGKLTQGLIDRILNPLNYINNFSKLSQGLVKDVTANIEDEKDNMDQENYEDTMDVLNMLEVNLQKVGEHGANTTRTLKAMEEMLKNHSGNLAPMDLCAMLKQNHKMIENYYKNEIALHHIDISFQLPSTPLMINGNTELLSKTVMSLLANAVYAVCKKDEKKERTESGLAIKLKLHQSGKTAYLTIHDNGTGISENILHKIFDPFFTTKTTGEASGVGLYLSKEITQNHGGDITVESVKNEYTEFTITLPTL